MVSLINNFSHTECWKNVHFLKLHGVQDFRDYVPFFGATNVNSSNYIIFLDVIVIWDLHSTQQVRNLFLDRKIYR